MPNLLSPVLRPLGLDPSQGYDTAAAGARTAQSQANALSDLQWQRQMAGLQQAQGAANQFQSLFNSVYGASPGYGMAQAPAGASMLLPAPSGANSQMPTGIPTSSMHGWAGRDDGTGVKNALSKLAPWAPVGK